MPGMLQSLFDFVQDAIVSSTNQKSNKRVKDEQEFYDYEVYSPVSLAWHSPSH